MSSEQFRTSQIFVFEKGIPDEIRTDEKSRLSLSANHYKVGRHALKWDFMNKSYLQINNAINYPAFETSNDQKKDTFSFWIYNEKPIQGNLTIEFGRDEKVDCSFQFGLNFSGWRTAWVAYDRDMTGVPQTNMNKMTIHTPSHLEKGTLYLDQIILSSSVDPRHHISDEQVPFINPGLEKRINSHWMALYHFYNLEPTTSFEVTVTVEESHAIRLIKERFENEHLLSGKPLKNDVEALLQHFKTYNIVRQGKSIKGRPVNYKRYQDLYPENTKEFLISLSDDINLKDYTQYMLEIAQTYRGIDNENVKQQLSQVFIDLFDHIRDQGWSAGSGQGTLHHLGYEFRSYYIALFLMRDVLQAHNKLADAHQDMYWFSGGGRVFVNPAENSGGIIDIFNTTLDSMLSSFLVADKESEQVGYLYELSQWISRFLRNAPGLMSCFKVDGSVFHHAGHYPAYAIGGFQGVAPVVYFLSKTPFHIAKDAHANLRKALLTMRLYSNKYQWLLSLSGRHPTGSGALKVAPFQYLAMAGSPENKAPIDEQVAAAYMRLKPNISSHSQDVFEKAGVFPERNPNGHWTLNYAALSIHRRKNWLVGAKGHSRYVWANETYWNANLYGRYITYGHVQVLGSGNPVNNRDSGFKQEGWDWSRWPGTTVIHLPVDDMRSDVKNVDHLSGVEEMLLSDETYAGGVNLTNENGLFAMKLHEHPKYNGSHRARKSVFFFDDRVICLGSDIENNDSKHHTETVLFQNHLTTPDEPIWLNDSEPIRTFPYEYSATTEKPHWLMDYQRNGYYIPAGQALNIARHHQTSRDQRTEEKTYGDFVIGSLIHGHEPNDEQYEYAMCIQTTPEKMQHFTEQMSQPETALYTVLQKNTDAHIVRDQLTGIVGYALFEKNDHLVHDLVTANSRPCMVMTQKKSNHQLQVSVVDPDLRFYEGPDESQYDANGLQKEVSVYSRNWRGNESESAQLRLTLSGQWQLDGPINNCSIVPTHNRNITTLEFTLQDGLKSEISLKKTDF